MTGLDDNLSTSSDDKMEQERTYSRLLDLFMEYGRSMLLDLLIDGDSLDPRAQSGTPPPYESMFRRIIPCESGGRGTSTPSAMSVISFGRFNDVACCLPPGQRIETTVIRVKQFLTLIASSAPKIPYQALLITREKKRFGRCSRSYTTYQISAEEHQANTNTCILTL